MKNIILLVLALVNAFLLFLVLQRESRSSEYDRRAVTHAAAILKKNGITFDTELLPEENFPPLQMQRDAAAELAAARAVLGDAVQVSEQGAAAIYESALGSARFARSGEFRAELEPGACPLDGVTPEEYTGALLTRMGVAYDALTAWEEEGVLRVSLHQSFGGAVIFPCRITAEFVGDELRSISGVRLTGTPGAAAGEPMSPVTLLVKLNNGIVILGDICTEISGVEQGYQFTAGLSDPVELTPVWRIKTDTARYYLNTVTGELSRAD